MRELFRAEAAPMGPDLPFEPLSKCWGQIRRPLDGHDEVTNGTESFPR